MKFQKISKFIHSSMLKQYRGKSTQQQHVIDSRQIIRNKYHKFFCYKRELRKQFCVLFRQEKGHNRIQIKNTRTQKQQSTKVKKKRHVLSQKTFVSTNVHYVIMYFLKTVIFVGKLVSKFSHRKDGPLVGYPTWHAAQQANNPKDFGDHTRNDKRIA